MGKIFSKKQTLIFILLILFFLIIGVSLYKMNFIDKQPAIQGQSVISLDKEILPSNDIGRFALLIRDKAFYELNKSGSFYPSYFRIVDEKVVYHRIKAENFGDMLNNAELYNSLLTIPSELYSIAYFDFKEADGLPIKSINLIVADLVSDNYFEFTAPYDGESETFAPTDEKPQWQKTYSYSSYTN